ncbi:MAG: transglycosylase domain-containing protein [Gemmatimonadetes bacterium]|nr:transglycosylase domain-containing protein [Gemmatimonadota bacterium]
MAARAPTGRIRRKPPKKAASTRVLRGLAVLTLLAAVAVGGGLIWLWPRCSGASCPSVVALREYTPPQASRVLDRDGRVLAHLAPERRIVIPLERIPAKVAGAFLAVEDKRFFEHEGVDYRRAMGALVRDIQTMSFRQGFSTITMQLARNVFPEHLTREKTLKRKAWEIVLARQIEKEFAKDEILEMYLNQIYLGNGLYGVEAAAHGYFGKPAVELDESEAALLAAIPKAPSTYDPRRNVAAAVRRRNLVLLQMADAGLISPIEAQDARSEPLGLTPPQEARGAAPYVVAAVRRELRERFGPEADNAGYIIRTAVDRDLQRTAETALREQLASIEDDELGNFRGASCSDGEIADARRCLQGLFVAMDATNGDILALVGGRDYASSQFDRVYQARRQPGSAFKPILYATAISAGIPISTQLVGPGSTDFEGGYQPADHVADSLSLDLREALRLSSNRASVALGERVGVQPVIQTARSLGITTRIEPYPSTFLGAAAVMPLQLVAAFTAFANEGIRSAPRLILRVEDADGEVLYQAPVAQKLAFTPEAAFLTTSLMREVVDHGTGYPARAAGLRYEVPAAGKTGTTNESTDAWFVGVTPDIAAGVWIGFDQPRTIFSGADGSKLAAPLWGRILGKYYASRPTPAEWAPPANVVSATIDRASGMLATAGCGPADIRDEWFIVGTEPVEYCPLHPEPGIGGWFSRRVRDLGELFGGERDTATFVPRQRPGIRR